VFKRVYLVASNLFKIALIREHVNKGDLKMIQQQQQQQQQQQHKHQHHIEKQQQRQQNGQ